MAVSTFRAVGVGRSDRVGYGPRVAVDGGPDRVAAPRWLAEHAQRFRESGAAPAVPRLAATVVLLRDHQGRLEIYTQRRAATMAFAPGMYAFPGGSVSSADLASVDGAPADTTPDDPIRAGGTEPPTEPSADGSQPGSDGSVIGRMGLPPATARAVLHAAVREVAEETNVTLDTTALAPWARWLTPEFEPRRFDTFFFLAPLPEGQSPVDPSGEADHALWVPPAEALSRLPMLPPTRQVLTDLAGFADVASALAAAAHRDVSEPVRPVIEVDEEGAWLRLR
jgi:8-oxo-dGTP pyrophosphatase MutT (NUDIX family)